MTWLLLLIGVFLTLGTAVFVAAEFSLVALDKYTVEKAVQQGDKRAKGVLNALTHLSTNLSGAQVGITITTLIFGFAVKEPLAEVLRPLLGFAGLDGAGAAAVSVSLAMVLSYAFSVVFGELIPKNLAIAEPFGTAKVVAPLQHFFTMLFKPLITMFNATANFFLRLMGIQPQEELSGARSPAELDALVRRSAQAGTLDSGTAVLLSRTLGLSERTASDVLTHRGAMVSIDASCTAADILALTQESGHSRFPVTDDNEDDVVGIVQVRQAVSVPRSERMNTTAADLMSDVVRVPETVGLDSLLVELRSAGAQLAVVLDEYGGTAGIVTLEDVIEEIVGEVSDEHDTDEPERFLPGADDSEWTVSGLMRPDEILREMRVRIPESPHYETLGGLIMDELGRIPLVGDRVDVGGVSLEVAALDGRRVDSVRLRVIDESARVHDGENDDEGDNNE